MVGLNPEFAHETMSGLSFSQAVAQTLWHDKLFHIDLNAQRIGKFDQDFRFGSEGIRDAFYVVKLLEDAQWNGMRHFDAHPYRTEDSDGVWDFARGCMRTYLILADKARRFHEDTDIQDALRTTKAAELGEPTSGEGGLDGHPVVGLRRGRPRGAGVRQRAPGPTRDGIAPRGALVPLVVGVDSSTSACKVQVRDAETGTVVSSGRAPHPADDPTPERTGPSGLGNGLSRCMCRGTRCPRPITPTPSPWRHSSTVSSSSTTMAKSSDPAKLWNDTESAPDTEELLTELAGGASGLGCGLRERAPSGLHGDQTPLVAPMRA